jgi:hypothetical protein
MLSTIEEKLEKLNEKKKNAAGNKSSENLNESASVDLKIDNQENNRDDKNLLVNVMLSALSFNDDLVTKSSEYELIKNIFNLPEDDQQELNEEIERKFKMKKAENIFEHSLLFTKIVKQEILKLEAAKCSCNGKLSENSMQVLLKHSKFLHLTKIDEIIASFIGLAEMQAEENVDLNCNEELVENISSENATEEVAERFWKSCEMMIEFFLEFVEKLPQKSDDKDDFKSLEKIFKIVAKLENLLPKNSEKEIFRSFEERVKSSFAIGVSEYMLELSSDSVRSNQYEKIKEFIDKANKRLTLLHQEASAM